MSEAVVVGGGLSGAAAAALLAGAGQAVRVLERERGPRHKICGEFLSVEAQRHLAGVGLDVGRLGGAPISRLRLVCGTRQVEAPLPFTALGLTRRRLDEALLEHAAGLGAQVERGVSVRSLGPDGLQTSGGSLPATPVLLATGKHALRGAPTDARGVLDRYIGFKMYFATPAPARAALEGWIEVVLFDGGYAGLQLVEGGVANLCLLVRDAAFADLGGTWSALLARLLEEPHLARRLGEAQPQLDRPLTIARTPYGFLHRDTPDAPEGPYRLGDQAAVIPSFCGDGMAIALHSARLAAAAIGAGAPASAYHGRLRRAVGLRVRSATALQRLGEGRIGRELILRAAALAPGSLGLMAALSRIPEGALRAAGLPAPGAAAHARAGQACPGRA